jgi:hypothetical protein
MKIEAESKFNVGDWVRVVTSPDTLHRVLNVDYRADPKSGRFTYCITTSIYSPDKSRSWFDQTELTKVEVIE